MNNDHPITFYTSASQLSSLTRTCEQADISKSQAMRMILEFTQAFPDEVYKKGRAPKTTTENRRVLTFQSTPELNDAMTDLANRYGIPKAVLFRMGVNYFIKEWPSVISAIARLRVDA